MYRIRSWVPGGMLRSLDFVLRAEDFTAGKGGNMFGF